MLDNYHFYPDMSLFQRKCHYLIYKGPLIFLKYQLIFLQTLHYLLYILVMSDKFFDFVPEKFSALIL